jgi:hypothetical protein
MGAWAGFMWVRIGMCSGFLWLHKWTNGLHKIRGNCWTVWGNVSFFNNYSAAWSYVSYLAGSYWYARYAILLLFIVEEIRNWCCIWVIILCIKPQRQSINQPRAHIACTILKCDTAISTGECRYATESSHNDITGYMTIVTTPGGLKIT